MVSLKNFFRKIVRPAGHRKNGAAKTAAEIDVFDTNGGLSPELVAQNEEKDRLVKRFREWLDELPESPETPIALPESHEQTDLYSLFAEFVSLKNEIKIESRQFKSGFDEFRKALALLESSHVVIQKTQDALGQSAGQIRLLAIRVIVTELLEIRDRIEDSLQTLDGLAPKMLRWRYRRKNANLFASLRQGQNMLLNRIENLLRNHEVTAIETGNQLFDPRIMRAVEVASERKAENGLVVAELRRGYLLRGEIIRIAEVKVNKHVQ